MELVYLGVKLGHPKKEDRLMVVENRMARGVSGLKEEE
jgi:hypothetical protein